MLDLCRVEDREQRFRFFDWQILEPQLRDQYLLIDDVTLTLFDVPVCHLQIRSGVVCHAS